MKIVSPIAEHVVFLKDNGKDRGDRLDQYKLQDSLFDTTIKDSKIENRLDIERHTLTCLFEEVLNGLEAMAA